MNLQIEKACRALSTLGENPWTKKHHYDVLQPVESVPVEPTVCLKDLMWTTYPAAPTDWSKHGEVEMRQLHPEKSEGKMLLQHWVLVNIFGLQEPEELKGGRG